MTDESAFSRPAWRRPFLLDPGEGLLITNDPVRSLANHLSAANAIGIQQKDLAMSRLSPMPIPVRAGRPKPHDKSTRRLEGVDPRMMWLPLMWLPERLTQRLSYQVVDGDVVVIDPRGVFRGDPRATVMPTDGVAIRTETSDEWVVRIALELEAAGCYDQETGTWIDVLDSVGINVDEIDDVKRVERWLAGAADSDLDWLDANYLNDGWHVPRGEEPTWALRNALAVYPDLLDATWARSATSMLDVIDDVTTGVAHGDLADGNEAKGIVNMICMMSIPLLQWYTDDEATWWREMSKVVESFEGSANDLVAGPLAEIDDRLTGVRDTCWPKMEAAYTKYQD